MQQLSATLHWPFIIPAVSPSNWCCTTCLLPLCGASSTQPNLPSSQQTSQIDEGNACYRGIGASPLQGTSTQGRARPSFARLYPSIIVFAQPGHNLYSRSPSHHFNSP